LIHTTFVLCLGGAVFAQSVLLLVVSFWT